MFCVTTAGDGVTSGNLSLCPLFSSDQVTAPFEGYTCDTEHFVGYTPGGNAIVAHGTL